MAVLTEHDGDMSPGRAVRAWCRCWRCASPSHRAEVDLASLDELSYLRARRRPHRIGAMTRARTVETADLVAGRVPLLPAALRRRARHDPQPQHDRQRRSARRPRRRAARGPAGTGRRLVTTGPGGRRTIAAADFFRGFLDTALEPGEVLTRSDQPSRRGCRSRCRVRPQAHFTRSSPCSPRSSWTTRR
ncbi:hypothetical protein HBB16_06475 [Pseudonocardia sp. MCCB 268]|nr:hypothetical protein [Pseudonocardia cytotoxica]